MSEPKLLTKVQFKQNLKKLQNNAPIPVLDQGSVQLIDALGGDQAIVNAARVSYGAGTRRLQEDPSLIRYLMRHQHWTPFEMCEYVFRVRIPMDAWRQMIRHRMASVNEYSTRYSEAIEATQKTGKDAWRLQSTSNKQGSSGFLEAWPDGDFVPVGEIDPDTLPGEYLTRREADFHAMSRQLYEERLAMGVAKEQARKDLPLSTYTEAYWKVDLRNLFNYLALRMDAHAQLEIRTYANTIAEFVKKLNPVAYNAFVDYMLESTRLTRLDTLAIQMVMTLRQRPPVAEATFLNLLRKKKNSKLFPNVWKPVSVSPGDVKIKSCRERDECVTKLRRLGLISVSV